MDNINKLVSEAISDFREIAALAHVELSTDSIKVEISVKPHEAPKTLPHGQMAVYAFFLNGQALKVGKVGQKSAERYTSQHYNPESARSTLAQSILTNAKMAAAVGVEPGSAGDWIRENTDRVNMLLPAASGIPILSLLESFLHVRWRPLFEGRSESD